MVEDITERKNTAVALQRAKDEAERANRAKSEFLSRMSHELRTPLNAILGFGQLLERQNPTETQRGRIHHIVSAGRHPLDLINEVLDISRIEVGRVHLPLEPVCVGGAVMEAISLVRPLAAERAIELAPPVRMDTGWYVQADQQRFKQVLLNLLANAVKYTPVGGRITISYRISANNGLRILVSDTGPGIPDEKLPRLFTPFDRLGAEQSDVQGTGLGLALSQRLMEAMHGTIGVETVVGQGSTFWVELPAAESPLRRLAVHKKNGATRRKEPAQAQRRKVLYIEDNLSNGTLMEQMLQEKPEIELMTAIQGKIGLDLARQHSPDLILLDLHLPDLAGWDVLSQLQASETTRDIPAIVVSADATSRQIERLMAAGARGYLTKPLNIGEFFRVLDKTKKTGSRTKQAAAA